MRFLQVTLIGAAFLATAFGLTVQPKEASPETTNPGKEFKVLVSFWEDSTPEQIEFFTSQFTELFTKSQSGNKPYLDFAKWTKDGDNTLNRILAMPSSRKYGTLVKPWLEEGHPGTTQWPRGQSVSTIEE